MSSVINATTSSGIAVSGDNSGQLEIQTNSGTTAITVTTGQGVKVKNTIGVGDATPSTSGAGITFPATQSASTDANTLDDYEEGTWTPVIDSVTAGTSRATTVYYATYTKIGNICQFQAFATIATLGSGGSGNLTVKGLPFTSPSSGGNAVSAVSLGYFDNLNSNVVDMGCYVQDNSNYVVFQGLSAAGASYSGITFSTYAKAGTSLMIAGTYRVA